MEESKSTLKILLIGEKCVDCFIEGSCDKISPESPTFIFKSKKENFNWGMAGNVYKNLKSLSDNIEITFFHQDKEINKTRYVDENSGYHLLRVDSDDQIIDNDFIYRLVNGISSTINQYSAIVISDYGKGLLSIEDMMIIIDIANNNKIPIFMDTKAKLGLWSINADYIKINEKEFKSQFYDGVSEPWKLCRNLIVTLGKNGVRLYKQDGTYIQIEGKGKEVFSVAGAGDTVLAALVVRFLETGNIIESLNFSMKAAAVAVSKRGVVAVDRKEAESVT